MYNLWRCSFHYIHSFGVSWSFLDQWLTVLFKFGNISTIIFSNIFFCTPSIFRIQQSPCYIAWYIPTGLWVSVNFFFGLFLSPCFSLDNLCCNVFTVCYNAIFYLLLSVYNECFISDSVFFFLASIVSFNSLYIFHFLYHHISIILQSMSTLLTVVLKLFYTNFIVFFSLCLISVLSVSHIFLLLCMFSTFYLILNIGYITLLIVWILLSSFKDWRVCFVRHLSVLQINLI